MGLSENNMNRDIWNNVELKKGPLQSHFNFSLPNIINTFSLIYWSNFPITSLVNPFHKMNMKWLLFDFFVLQKVPIRTSAIIKSTPKFCSASCLWQVLHLWQVFYILWSHGIYALRRWWFKLMCFGNMFTNF